ncbi:processive 1,2-diacylglycerol beta-glucosyltransferase [Clostridium cavendishii DSM 21758]|uniref:Processive 1,2-diacylglycerol beta-glucosyltransferase n=1 Tax=Clostridium cavendishii DSM 21758 TaxID=1121302 RepID=A0A1M6EH69_9CLOT|nr:glycosyltransferase [Clostridium cavendishii]SHI84815.1 processive 1,2-diacylglycerol beta-glucosyltransferase [Clostridium cavendishii DSM 21758]
MKILILTTSTGQGHNQAANSLAKTYKAKNHTVSIFDFIPEEKKLQNLLIVEGYEFLAKNLPKLYGKLYKITDSKLTNKSLNLLLSPIKNLVYKKILIEKPDLIIGTHPFAVKIIGNLKSNGLNVPFISVVTDFKAHYTYVNPAVDAYITATEYTKNTLLIRKVPENKIYPVGIPIREDFLYKTTQKKNNRFTILIMGGSMGLSGIEASLNELINNPNPLDIMVICGKNEILKKNLSNKFGNRRENKNIEILGFTKDIPYYMEKAHILISKPGGLTVSEAIAKKLPLVSPFAIPGQEQENLEFLESVGAAVALKSIKDLNSTINRFIINPLLIDEMQKSLEKLAKDFSLETILSLSNKLTKKSYA